MVKTMLFTDVKIKINFLIHNKSFYTILLNQIDYDKFKLKFLKKRARWYFHSLFFKNKHFINTPLFFFSNILTHTSLKILDIRGEFILKNFIKSLDSSVGRAKD